jgi:hypothetical protein
LIKKTVCTDFLIDDQKAEKLSKKLLTDFARKTGVFEAYSSPGQALPMKMKTGSREHALFLTYLVSIDYITDSVQLWKKSRGAYVLFPENFTPEQILKSSPQALESFVRNIGARNPDKAAKAWIEISKVLTSKYQGDPRNITKVPAKIRDVRKRLKIFPYLKGDKLSNFYIRTMSASGMLKIEDLNQLDIPVDKQVVRFTICSGALRLESKSFVGCVQTEPLKGLVEETWRLGVKRLKEAPWKLFEPITVVASKLCEGKKCKDCTMGGLCDNVKGIMLKDNVLFLRQAPRSH